MEFEHLTVVDLPEKATEAFFASISNGMTTMQALAAFINAWPSARHMDLSPTFRTRMICLPIPQLQEKQS